MSKGMGNRSVNRRPGASRHGWLRACLGLLLLLGLSATASAANQCRMADPNSLGQHVTEICWLQLDGVNLTANGSTPLVFDLPDGSRLELTAVVGNVSGTPVGLTAVQAPSWTGSQFSGDTGFYTIYTPNLAVLQGNGTSNDTSVELRDIHLFNPAGTEVDTPFELILADGESSNDGEFLDMGVVEGGTPLQLIEWLGASAGNNLAYGTPGTGTIPAAPASACAAYASCVRLVGKTGTANAAVFSTTRTSSPFSVVGQVHTVGGNQGFAFGLRWGGVKLRKMLPSGRLDPSDQFTYQSVNVVGTTMDVRTTSGTAASYPYVTGLAVMPGNTITLSETMAGGSASDLTQYDKTIACTNDIASDTVLPNGPYDPANPPTIDLRNKGDNVACDITNVPRVVDLTLVKTAPATVQAGTAFDYTLTISNQGTHTATGATFSDTLPAGVSVTPGNVSCTSATGGAVCGSLGASVSGSSVTGAIQSLPAGGSVQVIVRAVAPVSQGTITNTASVALAASDTTVGEPGDRLADNSSSASTTVVGPVLTLAKTASASSFTVGVPASYTLQVGNSGTAATVVATTITDTLPAGLTPGSLPAGCSAAGQTVTCSVPAGLATGSSASFVVPVTPMAALAGSSVTNQADITSGDPACPANARCHASVTTAVAGVPQLALAKSHSGDFQVGQTGSYTLLASNVGSATTSGTITVVDTLPAGLDFVSASGTGWSCGRSGQTVTCSSASAVAAGATAAPVTLTVQALASAVPGVTNTAGISGGGDASCPASARCTASDATTVNGHPGLALEKAASVADSNGDTVTADAGDRITYTFNASNTGDVDLANVVVSDPKLPGLSCTIASLPVGASDVACAPTGNTYTITTADVTAGKVTNTATATATPPGATSPPSATSPAVETSTQAAPVASFTLKKTASVADSNGDTVTGDAGDVISYTFSASNTGTVDLANVVVSDARLPGLACGIASLPVGASDVACAAANNTYTITAADVTAGKVTNTATATATPPGTIPPPSATSPAVDTPARATPVASFTLKKTASVADTNGTTVTGDAGDVITYAFSASNTGTVDLTGVLVGDPKLPGLSCTIASVPVGATDVACAATGNTYTITAADVANGKVTNTATATATAPGTIPPPNASSPTVETTARDTPVPGLALTKTASVADTNGDTVVGDEGDVISYAFEAANTGTVDLTAVVVSDPMLPGLSCTIASLPASASASCAASNNTHAITAADVAAGKVTNTATATATPPGSLPPPDATSPPVDTTTRATPVAGFTLNKTASVADTNGNTVSGDEGDVITYAFSATNTGTVDLADVVVSDPKLPGFSCTVASLPTGASDVACAATGNTYAITAADVTAGKVTNTATATATPPGTIPPPGATSGSVETPTRATPVASFTLKKTASVADTNGNTVTGDEGDVITYAFSASNTGTVDLANVVVSDARLPGLSCSIASLPVDTIDLACAAAGNTYTITAADVAAGKVSNTATASATPPGTIPPPSATSPAVDTPVQATPVASFTLEKTATVEDSNGDTITGDQGDLITYAFSVSNTGSVELTDVTVSDPKLRGLACVVDRLAVGAEDVACAASGNSYTITAADAAAGKVANTASATATAPGTIPPPATTGTVTTPTAATPVAAFTLEKTASLTDANDDGAVGDAGDLVRYAFSVANTGTIALTDVRVADPKLPRLRCAVARLAVGATARCAASGNVYTITKADEEARTLVNAASATAGTLGTIVPASAHAAVTTPTVATPAGLLRLAKQAGKSSVRIGDLVRYTVTVDNVGVVPVAGATLVDSLPAGFSYVDGSLQVDDGDGAGSIAGITPLRIGGLDVERDGHATVSYFLRVGAGAGKGVHTNRVVAMDDVGRTISNQASADVSLEGDPLFDDSLLLGTVFEDRNGDGWQASAAATQVHVKGGFAPSAYVPGSTTIDRGDGPQPLADHGAPLLHGIALGRIGGRQSSADSAGRRQVVIRQRLREPAFTDDFVLTTGNGSTLRMDAAGRVTVERRGDAADGLSAEDLTVERHLGQGAGGLVVDYVIRNRGIDERGIPGVRIASVEGLLMETDVWGRFHLEGVDGGAWTRGRNFILKVDAATLPPGATFTTENPRVRRLTPGLPVRFDFGVRLPPGDIGGGSHEVEIELGEVLFAPGSADLPPAHAGVLDAIAGKVEAHRGGMLTITATAGQAPLALARGQAVKAALASRLSAEALAHTRVRIDTAQGEPLLALGQGIVLGSVLFDTGQAAIEPAYGGLLRDIAAALQTRGGGTVAIVGRADARGPAAANLKLGMQRAQAVYAAISAALDPETRKQVRVQISSNPDADTGMGSL